MRIGFYAFLSGLIPVCVANLFITSSPETIKFVVKEGKQDTLLAEEIPAVINFLMGLPSDYLSTTQSWQGVTHIDIFNPPRANLYVTVHAPRDLHFNIKKYIVEYPTESFEGMISPVSRLNSVLASFSHEIDAVRGFSLEGMYGSDTNDINQQAIREDLAGKNSVLETLNPTPYQVLDPSNNFDIYLFGELQMLKKILEDVDSDKTKSVEIVLTSLDQLVKGYGVKSAQVEEAVELLENYLSQFVEKMNAKFSGRMLSEVVVTDSIPDIGDYLVRHSRSLLETVTSDTENDPNPNITTVNIVEPTSEDFPVIFSIVFWLMLLFFLAVLAVSYSMWFMDPGKDNIIYRVTGQRIKID